MTEYQLYFAFGSNMLEERMRNRCPSALTIKEIGLVANYRLVFNRKGDYENGGVASIVSESGVSVYGAIYAISKDEMESLDKIESPNGDAYFRKEIEVETIYNQTLSCFTYVAYPQGQNFFPTKKYLNWIIEGAENIGLPESYINSLKGITTLE